MTIIPSPDEVLLLFGSGLNREKLLQCILRRSGKAHLPSIKSLKRWVQGDVTPKPQIEERTLDALATGIAGLNQADPEGIRKFLDFLQQHTDEKKRHPWRLVIKGVNEYDGGADDALARELTHLVGLDEKLFRSLYTAGSSEELGDLISSSELADTLHLSDAIDDSRPPGLCQTKKAGRDFAALSILSLLYILALFEWDMLNGPADSTQSKLRHSNLSKILPRFVDGKLEYPVSRLLDRWVGASSAGNLTGFATDFVPSTGSTGSRIRKFTYWRSGDPNKLPNWDVIQKVCENAFPAEDLPTREFNCQYFLVATAMNRLIARILKSGYREDESRMFDDEQIAELFHTYRKLYDMAADTLGHCGVGGGSSAAPKTPSPQSRADPPSRPDVDPPHATPNKHHYWSSIG